MTPRPPTSTLFPYTTLFRSTHRSTPNGSAGRRGRARVPPHTDRKSTRLNSSHLANSYAAFCLKKKKQHTAMQPYARSLRPGCVRERGSSVLVSQRRSHLLVV